MFKISERSLRAFYPATPWLVNSPPLALSFSRFRSSRRDGTLSGERERGKLSSPTLDDEINDPFSPKETGIGAAATPAAPSSLSPFLPPIQLCSHFHFWQFLNKAPLVAIAPLSSSSPPADRSDPPLFLPPNWPQLRQLNFNLRPTLHSRT